MKRRTAPLLFLSAFALVAAGSSAGCGSMNALVGGECADGYVDCNGECVDLASDPRNCGVCQNACPATVGCANGVCFGKVDGGPQDGGGDGSNEGGGADGSSDGASDGSSDAPIVDSSNDTSDGCVPPFNTVDNCGACGNKCVAPNVNCVAQGPSFICAPICNAPNKLCFNKCISVQTDPENCGDCGVVCESNLCVAGVCQGASRGDIVYLGFDYQSIPINVNIAQARELINAVFLADKTPVRLLSFQKFANAQAVANVNALLAAAQTATGRAITITATNDENVVTNNLLLANYDVLLVHDQETAPAGTMPSLGTTWASKLSTFTHGGGVFITLDGADGSAPEMHTFATNTGLLTVNTHTALASALAIDLVAPGNAVGIGVTTPYGTRTHSVRFTTEANAGPVTYVATESVTKQPNVVHKIAP